MLQMIDVRWIVPIFFTIRQCDLVCVCVCVCMCKCFCIRGQGLGRGQIDCLENKEVRDAY